MGKKIRVGLVLLSLACLLSSAAQAQQTLGSINGTVTDSSGAVIHNAAVKIRNLATGLEQTATTKAEALRQARLDLLLQTNGEYSHPFYWAPFVVIGNWQ